MKTTRVRRSHGGQTITVTYTKTGRLIICETDDAGESRFMSERTFDALESHVRQIRAMIDDVLRQSVAEESS